MLKSYETSLLLVLRGLLADASRIYPADSAEFERDFSRLCRNVEARGLGVLTLELPALCKHFDRCLDNALWVEPSMSLSRRRGPHSTLPRLFWGVWNRVFDEVGMLRCSVDTDAVALLRQLLLFAKKAQLPCSSRAVSSTVRDFYEVEAHVPSPSLDWNGDSFDERLAKDLSLAEPVGFYPRKEELRLDDPREPHRRSLLECIQETLDILVWYLGPFKAQDWMPKHGPGVVSDLKAWKGKGDKREPRDAFKYSFKSWPERLESAFPYGDFAFANHFLWADAVASGEVASEEEGYSTLMCVPKTQKGPRLIAAEPVAHQWCQQAIWNYFRTRFDATFLSSFVSFGDQTGNQELARLASVEGKLWTVDLSAASDHLSCRVVERAFRRNPALLRALYASRTRYLRQDIDKRCPNIVRLKKFSTMGSACTFPVQSLVFLGIAIGSALFGRSQRVTPLHIIDLAGQVRVFGDDIIVPADTGRYCLEALGCLGFKVNESKTYRNGRFRESCGLEAFGGVDVTPSYVLRPPVSTSPESIASAVASSNNFFLKGWWAAALAIEKTVPRDIKLPVVGIFSGSLGYKSYCGPNIEHLRKRFNKGLHRDEVLVSRLSTESKREHAADWGQLLQYFTERPAPDLFWQSGVAGQPRVKLRLGWVESQTV